MSHNSVTIDELKRLWGEAKSKIPLNHKFLDYAYTAETLRKYEKYIDELALAEANLKQKMGTLRTHIVWAMQLLDDITIPKERVREIFADQDKFKNQL